MPPILIDILVIIVSCGIVYAAYKKGFIRTIISLVGCLVAILLASALSKPVAEFVFDNYIQSSITQSISKNLNSSLSENNTSEQAAKAADAVFSGLPDFAENYIIANVGSKQEIIDQIKESKNDGIQSAANSVVRTVIRPLAVMAIKSISFIIIYALLMIAVSFIDRLFKGIKYVPIVGTMNAIMGGVIGIFQAVVFIYIIAILIKFIIGITGNQNGIINESVVESSYIFNIFYKYNPLISYKI
ncbi:MAG: hypothetical protein K0R90_369 [Oscillospiraceae bacterium]|jgi:hypothetical protein|nr:hypothetical protein [Oscillospiraceae bacterium]